LAKLGIDVKGKIVIARYGAAWRGTKAKTAQERGAVGCLIYSDPRDDGYFQGDIFPKGPYRPAESAQRGSVMDMPVHVGDPLSPGFPSDKSRPRLKLEQAETVMKIPVLAISYADAQPLLAQLGGPVAPMEWRGALPITYHLGPGPAVAHFAVDFDWKTRPVYNVIARMAGQELPDEWVLYGNHHDAWVNGAADPISGAIALLETARALAEVKKSGWQPKRTLIFALWDAEEFGLIGSTEWVEKHRDELERKAIVYLNSDTNVGGRLQASGSPLLEGFLEEVTRDCVDPKTGNPLRPDDDERKRNRLNPPGAGSDYVAFVHHAGIPTLNLGFQTAGGNGTYHSIYDSVAWFQKHMDPDFLYSRTLAQVMATSMLRLSQADLPVVQPSAVERAARAALDDLASKHKSLDLGEVRRVARDLRGVTQTYEDALERAQSRVGPESNDTLQSVRRRMAAAERALTSPSGLPGRPWYRHQMYAPGLYTGYSAKTLPGIREAIEAGRREEAVREAGRVAAALRSFMDLVREAASELGRL